MTALNIVAGDLIAPFLWEDIADIPDWRERIAWPVSGTFSRTLGEAVCREVIATIAAIDDEFENQVAMVAGGRMVNGFVSLAEAAYVVQGEAQHGVVARGGPPELDAMRGSETEFEVLADRHRGKGVFDVRPSNHAPLRALARTASWTPAWRLPMAMAAPQSIAVTHNALLRRYARVSGARTRYWPAANILAKAQSHGPSKLDPSAGQAIIKRMAAALLPHAEGLAEPWRSRLEWLFEARLGPTIARICADVSALRNQQRLPRNLWTGTGGAYVTRVIASEVRRRGGQVTGFDHGGVTGISQALPLTALARIIHGVS